MPQYCACCRGKQTQPLTSQAVMPLCTIQPPAELSPHMSQHAMFWTLPALDTGQAVLPMVSGRHPSSAHRPFGSNHLMTQSQIPPPPPPRQPDIQIHLKTQPPSGHATYVNGEQGTFPMMHGSTMPIWHTDPSCKSTSGHAPYNTCEPGPLPGMQMPTHKYLPSACVPCGSQHKPSIDAAMGQLMPPESHAEQWSPDLMSYLQQPMTQPAGAAVNTWPGQPMSYMPCISQHSRSRPSLALGNPHASPSSINQPPATIHSHSWQETTQAPLSLPKEPYHTKRLNHQPCSQMGLGFPGSITPRPSMSHLMSYGNQSDAQAQMPAPPTHQQLYRHFTSLSSDHQHQPDCSEMLTHEVSEPQQPNLSLEDACSQDLPGDEVLPDIQILLDCCCCDKGNHSLEQWLTVKVDAESCKLLDLQVHLVV